MASRSYSLFPGKAHAFGVTGTGFQYDANGNMTFDGQRTITPNIENMPDTIAYNGQSISFVYDGNGSRVKKVTPTATTNYIDKLYECIGSACAKYIFAGNTRIAMKNSSNTYYYHQDHLGSTVAVTDSSGNKVENIVYYPFGENRSDTGSKGLNHRYTGQELDSETGLYNYGARLYDPDLARFLTPDTIVPYPTNPQSLNRYAYVINNPINRTDPSGQEDIIAPDLVPSTASISSNTGSNYFNITSNPVGQSNNGNIFTYFGDAYGAIRDYFASRQDSNSYYIGGIPFYSLLESSSSTFGTTPYTNTALPQNSWASLNHFVTGQNGSSAESVGSFANVVGAGYGASSAQWYADRYNETGSPIYAVGGLLSSLWTPDTYLKTASALTIGYSISSWAASTGGPAAIPELNFGTQGNNYFRVIDKANQLGFRIDKPHLGHAADGFTNYIKSNYPHPHFWSW